MSGKILLIIIICACLILTAVTALPAYAETLEEYKERIKKEQEEAERKKKEEEEKGKDRTDDGHCLSGFCQAGMNSGCFQSFFEILFAALIEVRYADYPFAPGREFDFSAFPPSESTQESRDALGSKFWMVEAGAWGSYLFGQNESVFDAGGIINVELTAFHITLYYQRLMSVTGITLDSLSADAGFSLPLGNFLLSLFAGVLLHEWSPWYFSFGASGKIFIPERVIVSWYALFAISDPFFLVILSPDVAIALGRFTLGLGFQYYNYNNYVNYGPAVKAAVWF